MGSVSAMHILPSARIDHAARSPPPREMPPSAQRVGGGWFFETGGDAQENLPPALMLRVAIPSYPLARQRLFDVPRPDTTRLIQSGLGLLDFAQSDMVCNQRQVPHWKAGHLTDPGQRIGDTVRMLAGGETRLASWWSIM